MKGIILFAVLLAMVLVMALGFYNEYRFDGVTSRLGELAEEIKTSDCLFTRGGDDVPVHEKNCGGVVSEDLALSDWERQYKVKSCFSDEWIYFDHKVECPNCGFLVPPFDQLEGDEHEQTCQRCGLHMEAWGNMLKITGRLWQGERYKEE